MKKSTHRLSVLCACAALLALISCGGDDSTGPGIRLDPGPIVGGGGGPTDVFPPGNVVGTVTSASDATPVQSAAVASGASSTTSLSNGRWGLTLGDAARVVAAVRAGGFADNVRVFSIAGLPVNVPSPVVPAGNVTAITLATGGTVAQTGTAAQIVLPGNALTPPSGVTAAASVDARITSIDFVQNLNVVPGDFTSLDAMSAAVPIEVFGVVFITATDAAGARYALGTGQSAGLRIPALTRGVALPATLPLMYFDEATARWVQTTSTATLNSGYYEGTVDRLGFWAVGQLQPTVVLTGCVRDPADQPVANARVILEGVDYNANATVLTAADGTFTVPLRANAAATVTAQAGGAVTNTVAITPAQSAANFNLPDCLRTSGSVSGLSIKLTWGALPLDLDSHLFVPNGEHVYYVDRGSLTAAPYAALDVDDITGFGPEVVTITRLYPGTYRYAVYNFSGSFTPNQTNSPARVELTRAGFTTTYAPPAGEGTNRWWVLFEVVVDSQCRATIRNVQQWSASQPSVAATSSVPCN
jgi:uncharacterized protein YfaP (DUF2135 family)